MALEDDVREAIDVGRQRGAEQAEANPSLDASAEAIVVLQGWLKGIEDALVRLAREIDALRQTALKDPAEMTPAERAALLRRASQVLDEMGDGSE